MMTTELVQAMPSKAEMVAVLQEKLVQLEFDYDSAGVDGITTQQLEDVANEMVSCEKFARGEVVQAYLQRGQAVKKALGLFGRAAEGNAWEWLRDRCGLTKRQAQDALSVWEVFGDRNIQSVSKFAPTTLAFLSKFKDQKRFLTNALQLADSVDREIPLSIVKSWVEENGEPKEEITFGINVPKSVDEAKAWILKKLSSACKRWPPEVVQELADVLRAAADSLNHTGELKDSPDED